MSASVSAYGPDNIPNSNVFSAVKIMETLQEYRVRKF